MTNSPAPPRMSPPRRRRVRRRVAAVGVVVLALLGVGLNWMGRGPGAAENNGGEAQVASRRGPEVPVTVDGAVVTPEPVPPPAVPAGRPDTAPTAAPVAGTVAAAPLLEGVEAPAEPAPKPAPEPVTVLDPDRFASLVSVVSEAVAAQHFGEARLTLDLVQALPLDGEQQRAIDRLALEFTAGVAALCDQLVADVRAGEALVAREQLARARAGGAECRSALEAALATAGLAGPLAAAPREPRERWPVPAPLARDRLVRVTLPGRTFTGRVVDCRPERVTLRVEGPRGVTFPTVPLLACEPIDVRADEAAELGFAAVHAGDLLLARLWLACALTRDGDAEPRVRRLGQLLR